MRTQSNFHLIFSLALERVSEYPRYNGTHASVTIKIIPMSALQKASTSFRLHIFYVTRNGLPLQYHNTKMK